MEHSITADDGQLLKMTERLDQLYLELINLYLMVDKPTECQSVMQNLEDRLETMAVYDDYAFGIMNEIANMLRKHENLDLATSYYKKALLCIKRRYKSEYLCQMATSKILINIATVQYLTKNPSEALKYFNHALDVLQKIQNKNPDNMS